MLKLNESCPQSSCGKVDLKSFVDELLSHLEVTLSELKHNYFEVELPLRLDQVFCLLHHLSGSVHLVHHLKVFGIFEQGHGKLLLRNILTASLNGLTSLLKLTHPEQEPTCYQPDFPLKVIGAALNSLLEELESRSLVFIDLAGLAVKSVVGLRCFNSYFPIKFSRHINVHIIHDLVQRVKDF